MRLYTFGWITFLLVHMCATTESARSSRRRHGRPSSSARESAKTQTGNVKNVDPDVSLGGKQFARFSWKHSRAAILSSSSTCSNVFEPVLLWVRSILCPKPLRAELSFSCFFSSVESTMSQVSPVGTSKQWVWNTTTTNWSWCRESEPRLNFWLQRIWGTAKLSVHVLNPSRWNDAKTWDLRRIHRLFSFW